MPKNENITKIGLTFNFHLEHLYFGNVNINIHQLLNFTKNPLNMFLKKIISKLHVININLFIFGLSSRLSKNIWIIIIYYA
jgi:hypothetical protein